MLLAILDGKRAGAITTEGEATTFLVAGILVTPETVRLDALRFAAWCLVRIVFVVKAGSWLPKIVGVLRLVSFLEEPL